MKKVTTDQLLLDNVNKDAKKSKIVGFLLILFAGLIQFLGVLDFNIQGFRVMVVLIGVILFGSGVLFILGSYTVPQNRKEFVKRFQKAMLDFDPDERLWGAQGLVGYAKQANFSKEDILDITKYTVNIVMKPPVKDIYKEYIMGDHLILLREIAVSVKMDKHTRKEFIRNVKPLMKLKNLSDEGYQLLADSVSYHPEKLPVQAYFDLKKLEDENKDL
ncbi:MAG: hypothetical protein VXX61_04775 [Asgard group archaeon]|nr:hypothetical protein [Asgard group archaeon]